MNSSTDPYHVFRIRVRIRNMVSTPEKAMFRSQIIRYRIGTPRTAAEAFVSGAQKPFPKSQGSRSGFRSTETIGLAGRAGPSVRPETIVSGTVCSSRKPCFLCLKNRSTNQGFITPNSVAVFKASVMLLGALKHRFSRVLKIYSSFCSSRPL
jgi:hypothetical protein